MTEPYEGGCLCGAVRYAADRLEPAGYCHCRMCQKASGAPVVAWTHAPPGAFRWTRGTPRRYRSSAISTRYFCGDCGSQLASLLTKAPEEVDLNLATLDHPEAIAPAYHIYTASRVPWLEIADDLPRHSGDRPK